MSVIWDLLDVMNNPDDYAVRVLDGEIMVDSIHDLWASGATIIDLSERKRYQQELQGQPK